MQLENSKGTRDFAPEDKILRNNILSGLTRVFENYGYSPLETPIIEKYDLMLNKGGVGEGSDALKEVFKLTDQGERRLALKFEQTLSFARFIGMNPNVKMPFKRYEIGPVFRDGPIKLGRYRQFWQCDVDIVGCKAMSVDAEMILLAIDAFKSINIDAVIEFNNRKILRGIIEYAGIDEALASDVIISIDKLGKIGKEGVTKELEEKNIELSKIKMLLKAFAVEGTTDEKILELKKLIKNETGLLGIKEVEETWSFLDDKAKENVVFNISLARGLGYYTGTIFEGFAKNSQISSSICGGGRYDKMIASLIDSDKDYPCIGISFGLDVLADVLSEKKLSSGKTVVQAYIIPINSLKECFFVCQELRSAGINADIDFSGRGISKNLESVNALGIKFALIIGPKELEKGLVNLKDMASGQEFSIPVLEAIARIKNI